MQTELKWFFEIDKFAPKSYCVIHKVDEELNKGDITQANPEGLEDIDILVYSPPCQAFSVAGKREGIEDPRGRLFYDTLPIIQAKQPKYALMENVKGLTTKRMKELFNDMLLQLELLGYNNYWQILNAKDYGIAQNRERVFVISIRNDIDDGRFQFPEGFDSGLRLKDFLEDEVEERYYINESYELLNNSNNDSTCKQVAKVNLNGRAERQGLKVVRGCATRTRNYMGQSKQLEIRKDELSNSITTVQKDSMVTDYQRVRKLTPLEYWRLMGFSDEDFNKAKEIGMSNTQLYKQAGNSICVPVIEEIYKILFSDYIQMA